jgi:hypothetical protein
MEKDEQYAIKGLLPHVLLVAVWDHGGRNIMLTENE